MKCLVEVSRVAVTQPCLQPWHLSMESCCYWLAESLEYPKKCCPGCNRVNLGLAVLESCLRGGVRDE